MPKYIGYTHTATALRVLSIVNLAFCIPSFISAGWESFLSGLTLSLNTSFSLLLLLPDNYKDFRRSIISAGVAVLISFSASVSAIAGWIRPALALLSLAAIVPLSVCFIFRSFDMLRDVQFLMMTASGWEIMISMIKCTFISFSSVIAVMAFVSVILSDICGLWIAFSSSLAALLTYVILFLRSITGTAFVTWSGENAPVCDNDVSKSAYLNAGEGTDKFIYSKICKYMEDSRPYLNPFYSLDNMSKDIATNKTYISKVLNENSALNFCQWVTRYRVEFAREQFLKDPSLKVRELSDMSGFNSQVTFNMAFKLFYGVTPGQWCKEQRDLNTRQEHTSSQKAAAQSAPKGSSSRDG